MPNQNVPITMKGVGIRVSTASFGIGDEEHDADDGDGQQVQDDLLQAVRHEVLQAHDVVGDPGHDLPGLLAAEEAHGQHLQVVEQLHPHVQHDAAAEPLHHVAADAADHRPHDGDPEHQADHDGEPGAVAAAMITVSNRYR